MKLSEQELEQISQASDSFYTALDGARAARDGLLKAGLVAVNAVELAGKVKEEKDGE